MNPNEDDTMMQPNDSTSRTVFQVQVGHFNLTLLCRDQAEAIRLARRRLCDEFPRLWEMVHNLSTDRFRVFAA